MVKHVVAMLQDELCACQASLKVFTAVFRKVRLAHKKLDRFDGSVRFLKIEDVIVHFKFSVLLGDSNLMNLLIVEAIELLKKLLQEILSSNSIVPVFEVSKRVIVEHVEVSTIDFFAGSNAGPNVVICESQELKGNLNIEGTI